MLEEATRCPTNNGEEEEEDSQLIHLCSRRAAGGTSAFVFGWMAAGARCWRHGVWSANHHAAAVLAALLLALVSPALDAYELKCQDAGLVTTPAGAGVAGFRVRRARTKRASPRLAPPAP